MKASKGVNNMPLKKETHGYDDVVGDVITVTAQGMRIEPRYSDPIYEKLDELCSHRKAFILDEIKRRFHV